MHYERRSNCNGNHRLPDTRCNSPYCIALFLYVKCKPCAEQAWALQAAAGRLHVVCKTAEKLPRHCFPASHTIRENMQSPEWISVLQARRQRRPMLQGMLQNILRLGISPFFLKEKIACGNKEKLEILLDEELLIYIYPIYPLNNIRRLGLQDSCFFWSIVKTFSEWIDA